MKFTGEIKSLINGKHLFASVTISIEQSTEKNSIVNKLSSVPKDLEAGAISGASYGVRTANCIKEPYKIILHQVHSNEEQTNPLVVACAATKASWAALNFVPNEELLAAIEKDLYESTKYARS